MANIVKKGDQPLEKVEVQEVEVSDEDLASLTNDERLFINYAKAGIFSDEDVFDMMGITDKRSKKKILSNPLVKKIIGWKTRQLMSASVEAQRDMTVEFQRRLGAELMERFDPIDEDDIRDLSEKERLMKLSTRVENMSAKDVHRMLMDWTKHLNNLPSGEETGSASIDSIRYQYQKRRKKLKKQDEVLASHGLDREGIFNIIELSDNGDIQIVEQPEDMSGVFDEEEITETLDILIRRDNNGDE